MHVAPGRVLFGPDADRVFRDSIEGPKHLAVFGVEGFDEAADAIFATVGPEQDFAVHGGRRHGFTVPKLGIRDGHSPYRLAGLGIERDEFGVERGQVHLVVQDRDPAVVRAAAIGRDRTHVVFVVPQFLAGSGVERVDVAERGGDVHDPVHYDGRGLHRLLHLGLENPGRPQSCNIAGRNLLVRIVALLGVVAVGVQEVLAVSRGLAEHVLGHRGDGNRGRGGRSSTLRDFLGRPGAHDRKGKRGRNCHA